MTAMTSGPGTTAILAVVSKLSFGANAVIRNSHATSKNDQQREVNSPKVCCGFPCRHFQCRSPIILTEFAPPILVFEPL